MAYSSVPSWQIEGEKVEAVTDFVFFGSKITVDFVTAAMKLKDICSYDKSRQRIKKQRHPLLC